MGDDMDWTLIAEPRINPVLELAGGDVEAPPPIVGESFHIPFAA